MRRPAWRGELRLLYSRGGGEHIVNSPAELEAAARSEACRGKDAPRKSRDNGFDAVRSRHARDRSAGLKRLVGGPRLSPAQFASVQL